MVIFLLNPLNRISKGQYHHISNRQSMRSSMSQFSLCASISCDSLLSVPSIATFIMPAEGRDPSGYVTSPPSVVVKVLETGRDDINGLLGIVVSYNMERERYLVHMADSQSTMALRKENLGKANMLESYLCQWQRLKNDPRVREKLTYYIS
jgi:hypothetical protein